LSAVCVAAWNAWLAGVEVRFRFIGGAAERQVKAQRFDLCCKVDQEAMVLRERFVEFGRATGGVIARDFKPARRPVGFLVAYSTATGAAPWVWRISIHRKGDGISATGEHKACNSNSHLRTAHGAKHGLGR
jgi:hypothetical protein